jgi:hypothetical protein
MNVSKDINKIINAKQSLYDELLNMLEEEVKKYTSGSELKGGAAADKISDNIKIIGTLQMPTISATGMANIRATSLITPNSMNVSQAYVLAKALSNN